jgi:hypothetical protein
MPETPVGNCVMTAIPSNTFAVPTCERSPIRRPDMDMSDHDDSLSSPARNPVFAIKTIFINKQPSENSGEITDETSRTTRTEEDEETQEISESGEDNDMDRSCHQNNHDRGVHRGRRITTSRGKTQVHTPNKDDVNNDACSTQSPFSVPTVDLFPVDSNHSILTNDNSITSRNHSKRSNNSLALSPSVSHQSRNVFREVGASGENTGNTSALRRHPKMPSLRPVERTDSFIQRRNKRLEQIKKRVMSMKRQRIVEQDQHLEQVKEAGEDGETDEEEPFFHNRRSEAQPPKSPSESPLKQGLQIDSPRRDTSKQPSSSSSAGHSLHSPSSTLQGCLSADGGRKEPAVTVRDSSPLSTRSESRISSRHIRLEDRTSQRSRSRSNRQRRTSGEDHETQKSPNVSTPTQSSKHVPIDVVLHQSPGSKGSSQYRNHRQIGDGFDHLKEELTAANLIISQQQERIKSLQESNEELHRRYDEAQLQHEKQLQGSLHALYQLQKKQEKTEQDLQLALKKIDSLNELHDAVAKIQQLTGLQLLNSTPVCDDVSIKSDGARSAVSAPPLRSVSRSKRDTLPLVDEHTVSYVSDASDSTKLELLIDARAEFGDCPAEGVDVEETWADSLQQRSSAPRRYSNGDVPEWPSSHINRKARSKASSLSTSFAPVVPSRQDQSQASYLDSAVHRKASEASPRRYSLQN